MELSVSILSIKDKIKENIKKLVNCDIDYLHLDIMDGLFVPNETWNINQIKEILPTNLKPLDVHLMVSDIKKYITEFSSLKPKFITFHLEASNNPKEIIELIRSYGIGVGISIKPDTPVSKLLPYLNDVDLVLLMSVEPGFGGQAFLESTTNKIDELYALKETNKYKFAIEVDGGVNADTINYCRKCDIVVVGSYITNNNYEESIKNLDL